MLSKILDKCFDEFVWPKWVDLITNAKAPIEWDNAFYSSAMICRDFDHTTALRLANERGILRFLINTFRPERSIPSARDFAIAIAFELQDGEYDDVEIAPRHIRNFAATVRKEWLLAINHSALLKAHFRDVRDVHPASLITINADCKPENDAILMDRLKLAATYFESYSTRDATEYVSVWLPNEEDVIRYDTKSKVIQVELNPAQGADFGFFRIGYDYSINVKGENVFLTEVHKDDKRLLESAAFGHGFISIGDTSGELLWLQ